MTWCVMQHRGSLRIVEQWASVPVGLALVLSGPCIYFIDGEEPPVPVGRRKMNSTFGLTAVRGTAVPVDTMKAYRVKWRYNSTYS